MPEAIYAIADEGLALLRISDEGVTRIELDIESVSVNGRHAIDVSIRDDGSLFVGLCCEPDFGATAVVDPVTGAGALTTVMAYIGEVLSASPVLTAYPVVAVVSNSGPDPAEIDLVTIPNVATGGSTSASSDGAGSLAVIELGADGIELVFYDWTGAGDAAETGRFALGDVNLQFARVGLDAHGRAWLVDGSNRLRAYATEGLEVDIEADVPLFDLAFNEALDAGLVVDANGDLHLLDVSTDALHLLLTDVGATAADW